MKTGSQRLVVRTFAMHPSQLSKIDARHNQDDHRQSNIFKAQKVANQKNSLTLIVHLNQLAIPLNSRSILKVSHTLALN